MDISAPTPAPTPTPARQTAKEALFFANYGTLGALVYEEAPSLLPGDSEAVMNILSERLPSYRGPLTESRFLRWAEKIIRRQSRLMVARNTELSVDLMREHRTAILHTIRSASQTFAIDAAIGQDDLHQEIAVLIWRYAGRLAKPGTAKRKYRIQALIRRHLYGYIIRNRKRRLEIVQQYSTSLGIHGVAVESDAERRSNLADAALPDYCPTSPSQKLAA